jgi:hypothetical protein
MGPRDHLPNPTLNRLRLPASRFGPRSSCRHCGLPVVVESSCNSPGGRRLVDAATLAPHHCATYPTPPSAEDFHLCWCDAPVYRFNRALYNQGSHDHHDCPHTTLTIPCAAAPPPMIPGLEERKTRVPAARRPARHLTPVSPGGPTPRRVVPLVGGRAP